MPRDTQIFSGSNEAGSKDYTLPGNSELLLLAVNANFVDNGAGSDWVPAVVLFSDSGHVISRACDRNDVITAGDDAEVSWFPGGLKSSAGSAGGTKAIFVYTSGATWFNSGPPPIGGIWNLGYAYDSSVFSFPNLDAGVVEILAPGKYLLWLTVEWDLTLWGTNVRVDISGDAGGFGAVSANGSNAVGQGPYFDGRPPALWFAGIAIVPTTATFPLEVFNSGFQSSGADRTLSAQMMVWQLDSTPFP